MKKLEFETSKGMFKVVDEKDYMVFHLMLTENGFDCISLQEITEEQAIEIVDEFKRGYKNYSYKGYKLGGQQVSMVIRDYFNKPTDSLYSLFDSKGICLFENPFYHGDLEDYTKYKEAEQKTFYNPYIFKL